MVKLVRGQARPDAAEVRRPGQEEHRGAGPDRARERAASRSPRRAASPSRSASCSSTTPAPRTSTSARRSRPACPGLDFTLREPIGVVGLIVPWNFPHEHGRVEARAGAGHRQHVHPQAGVVTPASARSVSPSWRSEAGFPPGIVNVVTGPGGTAGAALAGHPGVGKVAFTGETTTGQEIMRLAAQQREADLARAGRQERQHLLRRRRSREVRGRGANGGLRQRRPELHARAAASWSSARSMTASSSCWRSSRQAGCR